MTDARAAGLRGACRGGWPRSIEVVPETPRVETLVLRRARLAGAPAGPARRRAPHRRGRLPGAALLLDRLRARGRAAGAHRRAHRGRRGLALPRRRGAARATGSRCAARSAATSCGRQTRRSALPDRGRLGRRAAHGDAAPPRGGGKHGADGAPVLVAEPGGRDLPRRARRAWSRRATGSGSCTRSRATRRRGGPAPTRRIDRAMLAEARLPRERAAAGLRLRPDEPRRVGRPAPARPRPRRRAGSRPSGSARAAVHRPERRDPTTSSPRRSRSPWTARRRRRWTLTAPPSLPSGRGAAFGRVRGSR